MAWAARHRLSTIQPTKQATAANGTPRQAMCRRSLPLAPRSSFFDDPAMVKLRLWVIAIGLIVAYSVPCSAQEASHWGLAGGFVPRWTIPPVIGDISSLDVGEARGTELQVGVGRGRDGGGSWEIVYVRQRSRAGFRVDRYAWESCLLSTCATSGEYFVNKSAALHGAEIRRFFVVATIKRRIQVGIVLGAGVGQLLGTVERHRLRAVLEVDPAFEQVTGYRQGETTTEVDASSLFEVQTWPMGRAEGAVSWRLARGVKARVTAGLSTLTTYSAGVSVLYLLGARQ